MKINNFSWKIAGSAGDGILSAGMLFAKACMRGGLSVFAVSEYPSLIRGGHNNLDVIVREEKVYSQTNKIDMLIALNQDSIDYHLEKLNKDGCVVFDSTDVKVPETDVLLIDIPLNKIANENGGQIMRNTVAMGATISLLNYDLSLFDKLIEERFGKKSPEIIASNIKAAKAGYDFVLDKKDKYKCKLEKRANKNEILITGNEAISVGAIKAGCKFYSAYPMTPASSLLSFMAAYEKKYNMVVKHTEDEIAAMNMAIGAAYAGARAMTGTSGGGFALMVEALGLAAMTETPLVVVEAQRPGPATGMATHSGQADLRFVLHSATDEFPRVIIAPGDVDECFYQMNTAFNLAERYQIPVIVLTDKYLGESYWSNKEFDTTHLKIDRGFLLDEKDIHDYKRYKITDSGVSPRVIPGMKNGMHVATSYEHDEKGFEREEEPIRIAMHNKRFKKLNHILNDLPKPKLVGDRNAKITIVAWGSTKGVIKEIMKKNKDVNYLQILYLSPFQSEDIAKILSESKTIVCIENNKTGQLAGLIREKTGIEVNYKLLKYDGRPFDPEDIENVLNNIEGSKEKEIIIGLTEKDLDKVKMRTFKVLK